MRKVGEEQAMPRILNYKSYYEAFRLGVIDDGFTPVGRLLFFPLFDPMGTILLCDENDVPYEVNNKNASAWGNGTEPIPQKIQTEIGKKETLETWRYWEIVGALQWMGADRLTAYDTAKWIQQAKPGDTRTIQPGIDIQISEKEKNNV